MANPNHNAVAYDWANGLYSTVTNTSQQTVALGVKVYCISPSIDIWVKGGSANPTASIAAGSIFVAAGSLFHLHNTDATHKLAFIRAGTTDGAVSIIPVLN